MKDAPSAGTGVRCHATPSEWGRGANAYGREIVIIRQAVSVPAAQAAGEEKEKREVRRLGLDQPARRPHCWVTCAMGSWPSACGAFAISNTSLAVKA
jgi:hypothetical protein